MPSAQINQVSRLSHSILENFYYADTHAKPSNQIKLTNVSLVRMKKGMLHFPLRTVPLFRPRFQVTLS